MAQPAADKAAGAPNGPPDTLSASTNGAGDDRVTVVGSNVSPISRAAGPA